MGRGAEEPYFLAIAEALLRLQQKDARCQQDIHSVHVLSKDIHASPCTTDPEHTLHPGCTAECTSRPVTTKVSIACMQVQRCRLRIDELLSSLRTSLLRFWTSSLERRPLPLACSWLSACSWLAVYCDAFPAEPGAPSDPPAPSEDPPLSGRPPSLVSGVYTGASPITRGCPGIWKGYVSWWGSPGCLNWPSVCPMRSIDRNPGIGDSIAVLAAEFERKDISCHCTTQGPRMSLIACWTLCGSYIGPVRRCP